jgi:hypothetical protein
MESGFRSGTVRDVRDLCSLYGVTEGQRDHLMLLARESKQQGWWQSYDQEGFGTYLGLENGASSLENFESSIILGLLQTESYARAMYNAPDSGFSPEKIEECIEIRMTRQRILTRTDPIYLWSIVDEAALRRPVGGREVMRSQLQHLIEISGLPNVTIQVIPFHSGAYLAMGDGFCILEFAEPMPPMVYSESLAGWLYMERPSEVKRYRIAFESLRVIALGQEESVRFISEIIHAI